MAQEERLEDINNWLELETEKAKQRHGLRNDLDRLQSKHANEMAGIRKEKGIAIDKLRKEMLQNIRAVKN